jgi:hypothetical protein
MTDERRRSEFIGMLLKLGDENIRRRSMFHLLAVRCLETCTSLSFELQSQIKDRIGRLRPPTNFSEARAISSAGEMALPLLVRSNSIKARTAAACIRALRYIGSDSALDNISHFSSDTRLTVLPELLSAWPFFDRVEYAKKVLSRSPEFSTRFGVSSLSMLEGIRFLPNLTSLSVYGSGLPLLEPHYHEISFLKKLITLRIFRVELIDFNRLPMLHHLSSLTINAETINNPYVVKEWDNLGAIWMRASKSTLDTKGLFDIAGLKSVYLSAANLSGIDEIQRNSTLRDISLIGKFNSRDLASLRTMPDLDHLTSTFSGNDDDLRYLGPLINVEKINFKQANNISRLDGFDRIEKLRTLTLRECHHLTDVSSLANMPKLKQLNLWGARRLVDLSPIGHLKELTVLSLGVATDFENLDFISDLPSLKVIHAPARLNQRLSDLRPDIKVSDRIPIELRMHDSNIDL